MVGLSGSTQIIDSPQSRTFVQFDRLYAIGSPQLTVEYKDTIIHVTATPSGLCAADFAGHTHGDQFYAEVLNPRFLQVLTQQAVTVSSSRESFFGPDWNSMQVQRPAGTTLVEFTTGRPTTSVQAPKLQAHVGLMGSPVLELVILAARSEDGHDIPGGVCKNGAQNGPFWVGDTIRLKSTVVNASFSSEKALNAQLFFAEQDSIDLGWLGPGSGSEVTTAVADSGRIAVNSYLRPTPTEFRLPTQVDMRGRMNLGLTVCRNALVAEVDGSMSSIRYFSRSADSRITPSEANRSAVELLPSAIEMWRDRAVAIAAIVLLVITLLRFLSELASPRSRQS
jgi:hypothetical protein